MKLRPYQQAALDASVERWRAGVSRQLVVHPTGTGKCLGAGTPVMMADGSIRPVETIVEGDSLMGPDSLPRAVLAVTEGVEPMWMVSPVKGSPFVVTGDHILALTLTKASDGSPARKVKISVNDYLLSSRTFRHRAKLYRVPVEFPPQAVTLDPYYLGLWLGDGTQSSSQITKPDAEVEEFISGYASSMGFRFKKDARPGKCASYHVGPGRKWDRQADSPLKWLRELGLTAQKHIPWNYKRNSRECRLKLLAGLLDTDGHLTKDGCSYDWISCHRILAEDMAWLCRSLGLAAYMKPCIKGCNGRSGLYYRLSISGDTSAIPCLIPRKQAKPRRQKKDALVTGFSVDAVPAQPYYGFMLDGDGLFLLGDFTVTHNSLIMCNIGRHHGFGGKVMVLVHREELAQQNAAHMRRWNPDANIGIEMAGREAAGWDDIVVASVPTIGRPGSRRLEKFRPEQFDVIIAEEAHHSTAAGWTTVFEHFGVDRPGSPRLLLGVTATPNRSDGAPLAAVYDEIVHQFSIRQAIQDGWLVDLKGRQVRTNANLDAVRTRAGDFATGELEDAVNTPQRNALVVSAYRTHAAPRQAVAFCVDVRHAKDMAETFRQAGVNAQAVWGEMPNRAEILGEFRSRRIDVLVSVGILTEGWDYPELECILLCRPTKSRLVMAQQVGRGTRLPTGFDNSAEFTEAWTGKRDCLILDFVDNTQKHSLAGLGSLIGMGDATDFAGGSLVKWARKVEDAAKAEPRFDPTALKSVQDLETAIREVDLFRDVMPDAIAGYATMSWTQRGDGSFHVSMPGRGEAYVSQNVLGQWQAAVTPPVAETEKLAPDKAAAQAKAREVILAADVPGHFAGAQDAIAWTEALLGEAGMRALLTQKSGWRAEKPSDAQLKFARRLRLNVPPDATRGEVSRAIDAALAARAGR